MADWSEGYVSDVNYTYGYFSELNPNSVQIPFLMAGLKPPSVQTACELGFGQGMSLNIHATASNIQWFGTDFNPDHVSFARDLAKIGGHDAKILDESFREFCNRDDIPEFDFIGLHGVWTWISVENQHLLSDLIRRKLKIGGVVYISYNTLPGWATMSVLQHMLSQYDQVMGSRNESMAGRVNNAFEFTQDLIKLCSPLIAQSPLLPDRIMNNSKKDSAYLAHEYLNQDWQALYFSQVAKALAPAKLSYACSINFLEDFKDCNLTAEQQQFLNNLNDPIFIQSTKDYMQNKFFRRDLWVKGARKLSPAQLSQYWHKLRFLMIVNAPDIKLEVSGVLGAITLRADIYEPIIKVLSDYQIHDLAWIERQLSDDFDQRLLFEAMAVLQAKGAIVLAQEDEMIAAAKPRCRALNTYIMQQSVVGEEFGVLASPLTGGGFHIAKIPMMFLYAYDQGAKTLNEWVAATWQSLKAQGQCLIKAGTKLQGNKDNLEELKRLAQEFQLEVLQIAKRLQIVE